MEQQREIIQASCPRYACLECRTKTGWPHQVWCYKIQCTSPTCEDCVCWSVKKNLCDHPYTRRERRERERRERDVK